MNDYCTRDVRSPLSKNTDPVVYHDTSIRKESSFDRIVTFDVDNVMLSYLP